MHVNGIPERGVGQQSPKGRERVPEVGTRGSSGAVVLGGRGVHSELGTDANVALNVDLSF